MIADPKIKFRGLFGEIFQAIAASRRILLATHEHPDADGLGSMLAIHSFLKARGIQSTAFSKDPPADKLTFLPYISEVISDTPQLAHGYDVVWGFDYGDARRLSLPKELTDTVPLFITFDHHLVGDTIGHIQVVDASFSSTSEIVYWFFRENGIPITKEIAILIFAGIIADTGGFKHITTTPRVFQIAGDLLLKGILPSKIIHPILSEKKGNTFPLWGRVLSRLKKHESLDMAFSYVTYEDFVELGAVFDDASGVIALMNTVSDARFSLLLVEEEKGKVKGSLRSERYKGVDVAEIAKQLGGGGHKYAAGFTKEGTVEDVLREIEGVIGPVKAVV